MPFRRCCRTRRAPAACRPKLLKLGSRGAAGRCDTHRATVPDPEVRTGTSRRQWPGHNLVGPTCTPTSGEPALSGSAQATRRPAPLTSSPSRRRRSRPSEAGHWVPRRAVESEVGLASTPIVGGRAAHPHLRQPARQDRRERANVGRSRRMIAFSGAHLARARSVRPDRESHADHLVTGNRGRDHDEAFLVHAHPGDSAAVGRAEQPHDRQRVPARRRGVPARFRVQLVDRRP